MPDARSVVKLMAFQYFDASSKTCEHERALQCMEKLGRRFNSITEFFTINDGTQKERIVSKGQLFMAWRRPEESRASGISLTRLCMS